MFQKFIPKASVLFFVALTIFGFYDGVTAQTATKNAAFNDLSLTANGGDAGIPANLAAWHAGDGDTRDFTGLNNGAIVFPNTKFIVGKVGQAFAFDVGENGIGGGVQLARSVFRGQSEGTIETWVRIRNFPVGRFGTSAIWAEKEESFGTRFGVFYTSAGKMAAFSNFGNVGVETPAAVPQNQWLHVAVVHRAGEPMMLYVNGMLAATSAATGTVFTDAPSNFVSIGTSPTGAGDDLYLRGDVDDASVYTRALSPGEIQAIYEAGTAGKNRSVPTGAGANVAVTVRDATVAFASVSAAGETSQTPLDVATLPALPQGSAHTGLAYDISTTAVYTGGVNLCFNLPALAGKNFSRLRVLHLENGVWIDRTTEINSPRLCTSAPDFSPFVIADNLIPTAAEVTVSGRVTAGNSGIYMARITLTDQTGATRSVLTNPFGYYRFEAIPAGAAYILSASAKRYVFDPPTRILTVNDEVTDADFTAQTNE